MTQAATPPQQSIAAPEEARLGAIDAALLMIVIIWGLNAVIVKLTYAQFPPMAFMAIRFAVAGSLLLGVALLVERSVAIPRRDWLLVLAAAMVGTGIYQPLFLNGLARTTASNTSLIIAASPAFVALLNRLLGREILSRRGWLGIALAFAGILLIVESGGGLHLDSATLAGDLMILLGTILWATYTVLAGPLVHRYSPLRVTALTTAVGALPLMLLGMPAVQALDWSLVDWRGWSGLLFSAVFAIVVSYVVWNIGVKRIGGARTSLYSNLIPVVGTVAAAFLLGEAITPLKVVGAVVIFVGLQMARRARVTR